MSQRARNFTFTWNNYPADHDATLRRLKGVKYCIYGKEVGKECGTPHLQGTIIYNSAKTESAVRKLMKGCHIEVCKYLHKSITYCKKEEDHTEWGEAPKSKQQIGEDERQRWTNIRIACEEDRMDDVDPKVRFNQHRACEHFRSIGSKKRKFEDTEEKMEWYCGPSGTGKSRKAREENPDAYMKMCNKWWDGYENHDVVIIEDFDSAHSVLNHHMKIWGDRYSFLAEHKGGARMIRPKKIIVTSNYHPEEIWFKSAELEPILRRFKVTRFGPMAHDVVNFVNPNK